MKYELDRLGPDNFEKLIQSLLMGIAGPRTIIYGDGPDGGRDAVIQNANHEIVKDVRAKGYTVAQMKFKSPDGKEGDWTWLRNNLKKELDSFQERKETQPELVPETYLFFTNIILTPKLDSGTRDKAEKYVSQYTDIIPNILILGLDEIRAMLDNNPNVARSYAAFITPGLVLQEAMNYLEKLSLLPFLHLIEYAQSTFSENHAVRLEQAGSVSDREINIRNVYTDLEAKARDSGEEKIDRIAHYILSCGNRTKRREEASMGLGRWNDVPRPATRFHFVLIGNAGQGKSTLCQYICQIYRAALLKRFNRGVRAADQYFTGKAGEAVAPPDCERFPVMINLKDYAARLNRQEDLSVLSYICNRINEKTNGQLRQFELRELLSVYSWAFFFDGLDEVPASSNRDEVLSRIEHFLSQDLSDAQCDCLIVCTSRPQGYNDAFSPKYFSHYLLKDLSPDRCKAYIEKLLEHIEKNGDMREQYRSILFHALETPMTAKLMTTPLYTSIIVVMVKHGGTPPTKRYDLFHDYCEIICKREQEKRTLPQVEGTYDWIVPLLSQIGFLLQAESETKENAAAELTVNRYREIITKYLENEEYSGEDAPSQAQALYQAVINRLPFLEEVPREKESVVRFPLRSIQEYFAAEWIISFHDDKTEALRETLERLSTSAYWRNVYLFVAGYFAKNPSRTLINHELFRICKCNNGEESFECESVSPEIYRAAQSGSYLAMDMLVDNLFRRPYEQEKYLIEATKTLSEWRPYMRQISLLPKKLLQSLMERYIIPAVHASLSADSSPFHSLWILAAEGNAYAAEQLEELADRVIPPRDADYFFIRSWNYGSLGNRTMNTLLRWLKTCEYYFIGAIEEFTAEYLTRFPEAKEASSCPDFYRVILYKILEGDRFDKATEDSAHAEHSLAALAEACETIYDALVAGVAFESHMIRFRPAFASASKLSSIKDLPEKFAAAGLPELTAFIGFLLAPSPHTLDELLRVYGALSDEDQAFFRRTVMPCHWLLADISRRLNTGSAEAVMSYYDEARFEACRKREEYAKALLEAENYDEITKEKLWKSMGMGIHIDLRGNVPRVLLALGKEAFCNHLVYGVSYRMKTDGDFQSFCLRIFPSMFQDYAGQGIAIHSFANTPLDALLRADIEFPSELPERIVLYPRRGINESSAFEKISQLVNISGTYLQVYSLVPFMAGDIEHTALGELSDERARILLTGIRATGNRLALLGCILHILTGTVSEEVKNDIWEELRGFLREERLNHFWMRATACLSLTGGMLLYQALLSLPETQTNLPRDLIFSCRRRIREKLEVLPVDTQRLLALAEEAHRND